MASTTQFFTAAVTLNTCFPTMPAKFLLLTWVRLWLFSQDVLNPFYLWWKQYFEFYCLEFGTFCLKIAARKNSLKNSCNRLRSFLFQFFFPHVVTMLVSPNEWYLVIVCATFTEKPNHHNKMTKRKKLLSFEPINWFVSWNFIIVSFQSTSDWKVIGWLNLVANQSTSSR